MPHELKRSGKALYIVLCAILGALLFIVIQRAIALIYYLLLDTNFQTYSLGMNYVQLSWLNFLTFLAAVFFGLWYGVWLGLHWYRVVYEEGTGGWFHGFTGKWLHHEAGLTRPLASKPSTFTPTRPSANFVSAPVVAAKPSIKTPAPTQVKLTDKLQEDSWDLDDLLNKDNILSAAVKTVTSVAQKPVAAVKSITGKSVETVKLTEKTSIEKPVAKPSTKRKSATKRRQV